MVNGHGGGGSGGDNAAVPSGASTVAASLVFLCEVIVYHVVGVSGQSHGAAAQWSEHIRAFSSDLHSGALCSIYRPMFMWCGGMTGAVYES